MESDNTYMDLKDVWEKTFSTQEWGKYPAEPLIRFIAKNFYHRRRNQINILEIGCGPGPNIWYFAREGFNAYGIDISETAINKAKTRMKTEGLTAELYVGSIMKLPFNNDLFDCVVDNECLYCNTLFDTEVIMQEIKRVIKDNGLFFSRTLGDDMYVGKTQTKVGRLEYKDISDGPIAGKGLARLMDKTGISSLYGGFFTVRSIDKLEYTIDNSSVKVSEWIIISQKEQESD